MKKKKDNKNEIEDTNNKSNNKLLNFIKEYWFIISLIIIGVARFIYTLNLPNFYISNLGYDDSLMIRMFNFLRDRLYLGPYYKSILVKGPFFSFVLFIISLYTTNYSNILSLVYILVSVYFVFSIKNVISNKKFLVFIYFVLLFNPATYSQDLFQRLYRNSISIIEFIFFFGSVIRVLFSKEKKIYNYVLLGISLSFMFLTREDNLWTYPLIAFIIIYNFFKDKKIKVLLVNLIPILILIFSLNVISFINYKHYGIYTYNEIQKSEFHNTYKKILQIKDKEKIEAVSIPKSTLYMLAEKTKSFKLTKNDIDSYYKKLADENGEINNGNIIWYLRDMIYCFNKFMSGTESENYYRELGKELNEAFKNGTFEKEFIMPSIYMAVPTKDDLKQIPGNLLYAVKYTTTYQDIKTMTNTAEFEYNEDVGAYHLEYSDYHNTVNITKYNSIRFEIVRVLYKYFTIIFSVVSLFVYFKNIKNFDSKSIISHLLILCYLLIIGGVTYTHSTSFHSIRPLYLGIIYIVQSIFILVNISRINIDKIIFKKQKN